MPQRHIISLKDLVNAGCLQIGDTVYNMAFNSLTGKRDKLTAQLTDGYILCLIDERLGEATFKSINEFIRFHFNEKILRGESTRMSSAANAWLCTYRGDGTCFKHFKEFIVNQIPIPVPAAAPAPGPDIKKKVANSLNMVFGLLEKYHPDKLALLNKNRKMLENLLDKCD
jgi:hypothetical protein